MSAETEGRMAVRSSRFVGTMINHSRHVDGRTIYNGF